MKISSLKCISKQLVIYLLRVFNEFFDTAIDLMISEYTYF